MKPAMSKDNSTSGEGASVESVMGLLPIVTSRALREQIRAEVTRLAALPSVAGSVDAKGEDAARAAWNAHYFKCTPAMTLEQWTAIWNKGADWAGGTALRDALQGLVDFHIKPAGVTVELITDKELFSQAMADFDRREKALIAAAQTALAATPPTAPSGDVRKVLRSDFDAKVADLNRGKALLFDVWQSLPQGHPARDMIAKRTGNWFTVLDGELLEPGGEVASIPPANGGDVEAKCCGNGVQDSNCDGCFYRAKPQGNTAGSGGEG